MCTERGRKEGGRDSAMDAERPLATFVCDSRLPCLSSITGLILREETSSCRTDVFAGRKRETTHAVI